MATISQIKMPNNTTHDIVKNSFYGTCDTAAATAAKVVTLSSDSTGWSLKAGVIVGVKFTNTNSASNVTLNVNGSGAKSIWYNSAVYTGNNNNITGAASRTNYYMYDGTYWVFLHNGIIDSNTDTKVTQTADDSTASDFEVIFSATADNTTRTEAARKSSKLKFNPSTGNLQATQLNGVTIGSSPKFTDTNTHRPIQVNGTEVLGNNTTALNLKAGSNVSLSNSSGTVTIAATDTTYGVVSTSANGLAPKVTDTSKFLKGDGTWDTPTDTNNAVTQTATNTNADYEVLFSATADNTTRTEGARKYSNLKFNPSTGNLQATQLNGVAIGSSPKFTDNDTKNTAGSTDTSSKIFLVGATSQAANPQTYSDNQVYTTSGTLTSNKLDTKAIVALAPTGTSGSDKGSGVSPRYFPAQWVANAGLTVANGEVYFVKVPNVTNNYGIWLSLNNGTNYYPIATSNGTGYLTTHVPVNSVAALAFESAGKCKCYAKNGADATAEVTGCFRVIDSYDSNTTYSAMSSSELTTGTATTSRVVRADYLKTGINSLIDTKIQALDVTTSGAGASKTLTALSETDGKISATFGNISITKSQVSDFPTSMTPTSHTHGNITNGGALQTNDITIANGDKLVVTDSSDSAKVARTSISFDGSTTTKALTQKGTWGTFATSDTKNTAGSTDTSSKIFLIGATSQATNPQTYSHDTAYVETDGCLYSGGTKVLTAHQSLDPIKHTNTDIPEGAANLSATATAHKITAYRNGLTIPYKADNTNDGGMLRVRGTSESDCILELGTWDDSGAGETIQFNYYPTTSQVTPTYSVSVPKKSGTIALTSDIPGVVSTTANGLAPKVTDTSKFLKGDGTWATPTNTTYSAGTGLSLSGTAFSTSVPRVTEDANTLPSTNTFTIKEYNGGSSHLPGNNNWSYMLTMLGSDASGGYQLNFSSLEDGIYFRRRSSGTWGSWKTAMPFYSSSVSAAVNATTCTISDSHITTSSMIEPFSSNSKGNVITVTKMVVTAGKVVLTFPALSDATSFKVRITNI